MSRTSRDRSFSTSRIVGASCGVAALLGAAIFAIRWQQDWNLSEGTYALTARALLEGGDLYGQIVVAQPPLMFGFGSLVLYAVDSLDALRAAVALLQLVSLTLLAVMTRRVTGSWAVAAVVPPLGVLLPWSVHEQGLLSGEAIALPLLAGAALLGARRSGAAWAGALLAAAVAAKLPMLIPAVILLWFTVDRPRAIAGFVGAAVVLAAACFALFGWGIVEQPVLAQLDVGRHDARYLAELLVQAGWNVAGLAVGLALLAFSYRNGWRAEDHAQWRLMLALAGGMFLTAGSLLKDGTSLSVLSAIEPALLPPAVVGGWLALQRRERRLTVVVGVAVVFTLAQSVALLASPRTGGSLFPRPGAVAWGVDLTGAETKALVASARECPANSAFSGPTTVAFRAGRRMPGGQPDTFLPSRARKLSHVQRAVLADTNRCPVAPQSQSRR